MFKNATFKLTASYLLVVMFISLVFSVVVYRVGSDNLVYGLTRETTELSTAFPIFSGTRFAAPNPVDLRNARRHLLNELILTNLFVLVGAGFISYLLARETLKPIEDAHEQQKRFTADVSHELRTPLTALKMESEVALMDNELNAQELRKVISSNIEEAAKLDNLINNLLRLTRLEAGELQKQFLPVSLKELAEEAIAHVSQQAEAKHIVLKYTSASSLQTIKGDKDSLVQMLAIFLDNAIKYSPKDSKVTIKSSSDNNLIKLEIKDSGCGIAPQDLAHVFDRFYRADNARKGSSGFGLGLSIAKLIADVHNADITIHSRINHGTKVEVSFPK